MDYPTLMVNLELGGANTALLRVADGLAKRFDAAVIGIVARQPMQIIYSDGCYLSPEVIQQDRDQIESDMRQAETEFRAAMTTNPRRLQWRAMVTGERPFTFVAQEARSADLVLTGMPPRTRADAEQVTAGDLVMEVGRPVLVVPPAAEALRFERVLLAWKDTRECRRAALDALPLLRLAKQVTVIEITEDEERAEAQPRLESVTAWLAGHGIANDFLSAPSIGDDAHLLYSLSHQKGADLIVAGAYGHSRLREWAFGGVTRNLLMQGECCAMLSH